MKRKRRKDYKSKINHIKKSGSKLRTIYILIIILIFLLIIFEYLLYTSDKSREGLYNVGIFDLDIQGGNVLVYPNLGFENNLTNWSIYGSPFKSNFSYNVSENNCIEGSKCLRFYPGNSSILVAYYKLGNLTPGTVYYFSVMYNTSSDRAVAINLYDSDWRNSSGSKTGRSYIRYVTLGNDLWRKISYYAQIPYFDGFNESVLYHNWSIYLYGKYMSSDKNNNYVYYDDVIIKTIEINYSGCINNENSVCLDLGKNISDPRIIYNNNSLGENFYEENFDYRQLLGAKVLSLNISSFNVGSNGLLLYPMILEIRYKDNILRSLPDHTALIESRVDFKSNSPFVNSYYDYYYPLNYLGFNNDSKWKIMQYVFSNSDFPLIRSINNTFYLRIRMPTFTGDSNLFLPIDYINLRTISNEEYLDYRARERENNGFYETFVRKDEPDINLDYNDQNLVIFHRDLMKLIYNSTKPSFEEITGNITESCFLDEVQPISFGMYSENGIKDLEIEINDLYDSYGNVISKENIKLYEVIYDYSQTGPYPYKAFSFLPDRLRDFNKIDIAKQSSKRIWINTFVPQNTKSGLYRGKITIRNEQIQKIIDIRLIVYGLELEKPKVLNSVYHDPFLKTYSTDVDSVIGFYKDLELVPFFYILSGVRFNISSIKDSNNKIVDYNISAFENRFLEIKNKGFVKDQMIIELNSFWYFILSDSIKKSSSKSNTNLYFDLSNETFKDAFKVFIKKILDYGNKNNVEFIFSVVDEPGIDEYKRIVTDRLFTIIRESGANTTVTYYTSCENEILVQNYSTPEGKIPGLSNLVDYKVWAMRYSGDGYIKNYSNFGYYTTYHSNPRNPIYNRFLHGLYAFRTNASAISVYAMGDYVLDPYNDFDFSITRSLIYYPDFILAYPRYDGKLSPTMASEGVREGIKDKRYIETLRKLIRDNNSSNISIEASLYLDNLSFRISPFYSSSYANKLNDNGFIDSVLKDLSGNINDYEIFAKIRSDILGYIVKLGDYDVPNINCGNSVCEDIENCNICPEDCRCHDDHGDGGGGNNGHGIVIPNNTNNCIEEWVCASFSDCNGSIKSRTCNDFNKCNTSISKPHEIESCEKETLILNNKTEEPKIKKVIGKEIYFIIFWTVLILIFIDILLLIFYIYQEIKYRKHPKNLIITRHFKEIGELP
jgi:hypothetical protein